MMSSYNMFAATIGIDGPIKAEIGRGVARDDPARDLLAHVGSQHWQFLVPHPSIIHRLGRIPVKAVVGVRQRGTAGRAVRLRYGVFGHDLY